MVKTGPVSIEKFLVSKGGIGVFAVLTHGGKPFSEIHEEIGISDTTVRKRLDEASELGFIAGYRGNKNGRSVWIYQLTDLGQNLAHRLSWEGVVRSYLAKRTHEQEIDEALPQVIEYIYENPGEFYWTKSSEHTYLIDEDSVVDGDKGRTVGEVVENVEQVRFDEFVDDA